ncbi:MAG: ABC transporter permease subunit [Pseudomonadota bacterium]
MVDQAPPPGFKLSMLINDSRYRGYTFQTIAFIALMCLAAMMVMNAAANLERLGKDISFDFLWQGASYDIYPKLIPFESTDTHFRAAMVGVLNTLLVAFFGCITATIIGVIAGVLRLSNNWLVAKVMSVYVEIFRNVPVLLWILLIMQIVAISFSNPFDFRGEEPTASMVWGAFAFTTLGIYMPAPVWGYGSGVVVITFFLSLGLMWGYSRYRKRRLFETGEMLPGWPVMVALFFLPSLLAFFIMGRPIGLDYPEMGAFTFSGGALIGGPLIALWLALSLYTGAFIAENVRAGILAISKGQTEAAAALGLRPNRTMSLVVLPQALRVIIPPVISQFLNLTKNSSLAAFIGYQEITGTLMGITLNQTGRSFEAVLLGMLIYLMISLLISLLGNLYNSSVKLKER